MKTRFTVEVLALAGLAAGLAVTSGCKTTYSEPGDLSLTPMPSSLSPEPTGNVTYPTPVAEKPQPFYIAHPEAVAALDKVPAKAPATPAAASGYTTYVVKSGDSLSKIAAAHGYRTADVLAVNPGLNANKIRVGQTIVLPGAGGAKPVVIKHGPATTATGGTYVVQKGDILGRIANKHGVKLADLKKANGLTSDKIVVGQRLVIPGAKPVPVADKKPPKPASAEARVAPVQPKQTTPTKKTDTPPAVPEVKTMPLPEVTTTPVPPPVVDLEPPAPPTPDTKTAKGTPYVVQKDEDLFDIALRWGVSAIDLKKLNNLESDTLVAGQTILIPPPRAD